MGRVSQLLSGVAVGWITADELNPPPADCSVEPSGTIADLESNATASLADRNAEDRAELGRLRV
jgi:hypothetical protein